MLSEIGIIENFVSYVLAKFRTGETVGKVGTYCAAHSGPWAALFINGLLNTNELLHTNKLLKFDLKTDSQYILRCQKRAVLLSVNIAHARNHEFIGILVTLARVAR